MGSASLVTHTAYAIGLWSGDGSVIIQSHRSTTSWGGVAGVEIKQSLGDSGDSVANLQALAKGLGEWGYYAHEGALNGYVCVGFRSGMQAWQEYAVHYAWLLASWAYKHGRHQGLPVIRATTGATAGA